MRDSVRSTQPPFTHAMSMMMSSRDNDNTIMKFGYLLKQQRYTDAAE